MTRAKHRPVKPPLTTRRKTAIAGTLGLALLSATCGIANATAPHAQTHTAAAPTAVELPREPTGHGGPIALPTFADPHVWTPAKGPVVADGQKLPTVTAPANSPQAARKDNSAPKNSPAATISTSAPKPSPVPTPTPAPQPTGLLALVNADRATAGCAPVTIAADLMSQAQTQSNAQAAADSMFHSAGITGYDSWGENVAYGYADEAAVHAGWMGSAGHRANILNCSFLFIGWAEADSESGVPFWTEEFGA